MIQKREIEARIGTILSLNETPIRVLLQHEREPSEIFIEKMTIKGWWCLLVQKNSGETCIFESHKLGRKLKVIPFLECEEVNFPCEAAELLEIIASSQKRKLEVHELLCTLTLKHSKCRRKVRGLIELGEKRNRFQKSSLTKQKINKKNLENRINKCRSILSDCEMAIFDLTVKLKRL